MNIGFCIFYMIRLQLNCSKMSEELNGIIIGRNDHLYLFIINKLGSSEKLKVIMSLITGSPISKIIRVLTD